MAEPTPGRDAVLILLPGMDGTGDLFEPLLRELGSSLTTQVVRYPSTEPLDYEALGAIARRALPRSGRYVILGESFSGPIAVTLASEQPAGLAGVILCASFIANPVAWLPIFAWVVPAVPLGLLARGFAPWRLMGRFRTSEQTSLLRRTLTRVPDSVWRARVRAVMTTNVASQLARVNVPIMYLQGTEDALIDRRAVDAVLDAVPSVRVTRVKGPHCLLQCSARDAAREIRDFVLAL